MRNRRRLTRRSCTKCWACKAGHKIACRMFSKARTRYKQDPSMENHMAQLQAAKRLDDFVDLMVRHYRSHHEDLVR